VAKYAMIYFLLGAIVAGFVDDKARRLWRQRALWIALMIAAFLLVPNLLWNATHDFATFRHTKANIVGAGFRLDPVNSLGFLGGQFGVCGPVIFAVFLYALVRWKTLLRGPGDRIMLAFALPPLILITFLGLITSANANWAAPSAISMTVLAVALLVRQKQWRWLQISVGFGLLLQITLATCDTFADRISLTFLPKPDIYHRTLGWKAMSTIAARLARENHVRTIAADQSDVVASLLYYLRDDGRPISSWSNSPAPSSQFDLDRPLTAEAAEPILYLSNRPVPNRLIHSYSTVETLPQFDAATGPRSSRRFFAFKLVGARWPASPFPSSDR